jgi:HK97 gp10 family phage protein
MAVEYQVEGFPELFAAMDALKEEVGKGKTDRIWRDAMKRAFTPVLNAAKQNAPKDTGQLAERIYMKVHRPNQGDKGSKYYEQGEIYMARVSASPLRDTSQLHFQTRTSKKGKVYLQTIWKGKRPVAVSQEFGNASTPQHPFLRPALEANTKLVTDILADSLKIAIDEIARKIAKQNAKGT